MQACFIKKTQNALYGKCEKGVSLLWINNLLHVHVGVHIQLYILSKFKCLKSHNYNQEL